MIRNTMKKKCLIMIMFVCFSSQTSFAIDYKNDIRKIISNQFGNASNDPSVMMGYNHLAIIKNDSFVIPNGYHYVFKLKNDVIARQDESTFHGGNFGRFLFSWNNTIYALGGYGFFNTNNNLEYYNQNLKGWAVQRTEGNKPKYILGISFKSGNQIISFNNTKSGNSIENDLLDSSLYILDLKKMKWSKLYLNQNACQKGKIVYSKDFVVSLGVLKTIIVNTKLKKFAILENEKFGLDIINNKLEKIVGNSIFLKSFSNHKKEPLSFNVDIEQKWNILVKYPLIIAPPLENNSGIVFYVFFSLIAAIIVTIIFFKLKIKGKNKQKNKIEFNEIESRLINANEILNTDELDEIFGISHLEIDAKKLKRSRIIDDINTRFSDLIIREKDKSDKRKFVYRINNKV